MSYEDWDEGSEEDFPHDDKECQFDSCPGDVCSICGRHYLVLSYDQCWNCFRAINEPKPDDEFKSKTHKKLSASTTERWWNCPGSISLIPHAPLEVPNKYAAEGTYAHMMAELELKLRLGRQTKEETRLWNTAHKEFEVDGFKFSMTQEMRNAIEEYCEYILDLRDRFKIGNDCIQTETSFDIPGDNDLGGTADCVILVPYRRIIAIDFKYGSGTIVDVRGNKQTRTYLLGAYFADDENSDVDCVESVIFQPRVPNGIQSETISVKELLEFHEELIRRAAATKEQSPILRAGEWCKWCPAQAICKANQDWRTEQTGIEFADVPLGISTLADTPNYLQLPPERLIQIIEAESTIKKWFSAIKAYALGDAIKKPNIYRKLGYEPKQKLGHREWNYPNETVANALLRTGLLPGDYIKPSELRSPSQVEKAAKKKKLSINLSDLTAREVTSITLAKINTKLLGAKLIDDFEGVDVD
jgi:Protein of unknown function (DUF2800)